MISRNNGAITKNYCFNGEYLKQYSNYSEYLNTLDIVDETKDWRLKHIRGFINYLEKLNISFKNIKPEHMHKYIADGYKRFALRTMENRSTCIRYFLNYLYEQKAISFSGKKVLPKVLSTKHSTVPSFYNKEELKRLIEVTSVKTKKEYTVMLLFTLYGLRLKDVQHLRLDNIKWKDNKIIIVQSKDNDINSLPLIEELKYSLIEYLKYERPICNSDLLFVDENGNMLDDHFFYNTISNAFIDAGNYEQYSRNGIYRMIEKKYYSVKANCTNETLFQVKPHPHILRHSKATHLLNSGIDLITIKDFLGMNHYHLQKCIYI